MERLCELAELQDASHTTQFEAADHVVKTELEAKLRDSEFRYQVCNRAARTPENRAFMAKLQTIGNLYENMGVLVKSGLVDKDLAMDTWSGNVPGDWDRLAPFLALSRRRLGDSLWETFEYLTVLVQDWYAAHPNGTYPPGVRRIGLKDEWLEADKQYATSRASA